MLAIVVVTAVLAIAATLPIGGSAHAVVVHTAAAPSDVVLALALAAAAIGAAAAPLLVAAPRLARGARALRASRDVLGSELAALACAATLGAMGHAAIEPLARDMGATTLGAGLGLLATSVAVGSIGIAPAPTRRTLGPAVAALVALGISLGALPGGSTVGLAMAVLVWSGVTEVDAVEIGALATVPVHAVAAVRFLGADELSALAGAPGPATLAGAIGVGAACLALAGLRRWARSATVAGAALWTGVTGLALLAHAYLAA